MGNTSNYQRVQEQMDIDNYLEYFCANMYLANAFYGQDQLTVWRVDPDKATGNGYEDGRWRYLMPRMDNSMANGTTGGMCTSSIDSYLMQSVTEDPFFTSLLRNKEFRNRLSGTMTEMAETVFGIDQVDQVLDELAGERKKAATGNYKRFFGNTDDSAYIREMEKIRTFFEERTGYILLYTTEVVEGEETMNE